MDIIECPGDGLCYIHAVASCLNHDYGLNLTVEDIKHKIIAHLCHNFTQYAHLVAQKKGLSTGDSILSQAINFFENKNYLDEFVDLIMVITAHAMDLNLFIYQKSSTGHVQVLNFCSESPKYTVRVKYTHDINHPIGNHYDSIITYSTPDSLHLLSTIASAQPKIHQVNAQVEKETTNEDYKNNQPHRSPLSPKSEEASRSPHYSPPLSPNSHEPSKIQPDSNPLSPDMTIKRELTTSPLLFDEVIDLTADDTSEDSDTIPTPTFAPPKKRNRLSLSHRRKKIDYISCSDETYYSDDTTSSTKTSTILSPTISSPMQQSSSTPFPNSSSRSTSLNITSPDDEFEQIWDEVDDTSSVQEDNECDTVDEFLDSQIESQQEALLNNIRRGKPFPLWAYAGITSEEVSHVPDNINGMKLYTIHTNPSEWYKVSQDRRYFEMVTSNRQGFYGDIRIGTCAGAWTCNNNLCAFKNTSHGKVPNKVSFRPIRGRKHIRECLICGDLATQEGCGAKKYLEFNHDTNIVKVYHLGNHKCTHLKLDKGPTREYLTKQAQHQYSGKSAKEMGVAEVCSFIDKGDFNEASQVAGHWVDRRYAKRIVEKANPNASIDHNSFDAVGILKREADKKDPFYIYKIGNKNYGDPCDFVFKSSRKMAEIAIQMDRKGTDESRLQLENAYFDATHTRVHGFKSMGLWYLDPAMAEMHRLASMELRTEASDDIALFFQLFNEILATVKEEPGYKFQPRYFVCDESAANRKAIREVYGETVATNCVKGCKWHFKRDVHSHLGKIPIDEDKEAFRKITKKLCDVTTVANYNKYYGRLIELGNKYPDLNDFIVGVEKKKVRMFDPFRGGGLPGVNLSEAGNRTFKPSGTMRLVHAAKYDIATMMMQEKAIEMSRTNKIRVIGRGPSQAVRDSRDRQQQIRVAEEFVNLMDNEGDVELEAQAADEPGSLDPKPIKKPVLSRAMRRGSSTRGRGRGTANGVKKRKAISITTEQVEDTCKLALELMDIQLQPSGVKSKMNNPPLIVKATWQIRKCRGCKKDITDKDKEYPHDMLFQRRGIVGYLNVVQNKWVEHEAFVYYHLNIGCLRKAESTIEYRYISVVDDVFVTLDREEMEVLNGLGFLRPIVEKKL